MTHNPKAELGKCKTKCGSMPIREQIAHFMYDLN